MNIRQTKTIRLNEQGFASMVIALILILVLTLLTVGFAQIARREQQNALAKQLANQANFAAESGINDAITDIKNHNITAAMAGGGTSCINPPAPALTSNQVVESQYGVTYSCLLVNLEPPTLVKQPLDADKSWSIIFNTSTQPIDFTVKWTSHALSPARTPQASFNGKGFQPTATWGNHPGVLQFSITPLALGTTRDAMTNNTYTAYLYPSGTAIAPTNYAVGIGSSAANAPVKSGHCNAVAPTVCKFVLNMNSLGGTGPYMLHVINFYDASDITVSGTSILGPVKFIDAQAKIDATGRAKNVLKRLQVRVPLNSLNDALPDYALEAQDICKRFKTGPAPTNTTYDTLDPSCTLDP